MMSGYKTWIGAAIMGISAALSALGYAELAETFKGFGMAALAVGLGHKIEKNK